MTATPNAGYYFANWTEDGVVVSTDADYGFTVTADRSLVANFTQEPPQQTVSLAAGLNWWSTNLDITLEDLKSAIEAALGSNGTAIIKSQSTSIVYSGSAHHQPGQQLDRIPVRHEHDVGRCLRRPQPGEWRCGEVADGQLGVQ